jgi:hypothetical protein
MQVMIVLRGHVRRHCHANDIGELISPRRAGWWNRFDADFCAISLLDSAIEHHNAVLERVRDK